MLLRRRIYYIRERIYYKKRGGRLWTIAVYLYMKVGVRRRHAGTEQALYAYKLTLTERTSEPLKGFNKRTQYHLNKIKTQLQDRASSSQR